MRKGFLEQGMLDAFLSDFAEVVGKVLKSGQVKVEPAPKGDKGGVEFSRSKTLPATIYIPSHYDEYTKKFVVYHELAHLFLNALGCRQNEYIPDLLAAAMMWRDGYDPISIIDILRVLDNSRRNKWRTILTFLLLFYLNWKEVSV